MFIGCIVYADLFQYVAKEDPSYKWEKLEELSIPFGMTKYDLKLVSQTWKDIAWDHRITIIKPEKVESPTMVFLIIVGGWSKNDTEEMMIGSTIASGIGAPVAILYDVPRQPLFENLREDALIAYTFENVLKTDDQEWALLLPMTKTAIRAMDAVQEFLQNEQKTTVNGFIVAGASKRGWTTWLSAAADERIKGICPMVYDNLNLIEQMDHQIETWGEYSEQIDDYTKLDIPQQIKTEKGRKLSALVDPFTYRGRITIPKLIVVGSNDRYWPLDAMNIYFDDLMGERYLLRVPNKGHDINDMQRVLSDAVAFFMKVKGNLSFPELSWKYYDREEGLELSISPGNQPDSVAVWTSESDTKDFRTAVWKETKITTDNSRYIYTLKKPQKGYSAIFGEVVYPFADKKQFYLSTEVRILGAE